MPHLYHTLLSQLESFIKGLGLPDRTPKTSSDTTSAAAARKRKRSAAPGKAVDSAAVSTTPKPSASNPASSSKGPRKGGSGGKDKKPPKDYVHEASGRPLFPSDTSDAKNGHKHSGGKQAELASAIERDPAEPFLRLEGSNAGAGKSAGRPGKGGMGGRGKLKSLKSDDRGDSGVLDESKAGSVNTLRKKLVVQLSPQWHGADGASARAPKGQTLIISMCLSLLLLFSVGIDACYFECVDRSQFFDCPHRKDAFHAPHSRSHSSIMYIYQ